MTTRLVVADGENGVFLQDLLAGRLGLSRNKAKQVIDSRTVFVNRKRVWMARHSLRTADRVELPDLNTEADVANTGKIRILFEENDYLIINKPSGMLSNGKNSVEERMRKQVQLPGLTSVHRLDRDTSGCLLMAKNHAAFEKMVPLFQKNAVTKTYEAIVAGQVEPRNQTIKTPIDGQPAVSHIQVVTANRFASHLQISIETGRTHQIRKHMLSIDHPVIGDKNYGTRLPAPARTMSITRQMLHAASIQFQHPVTGTPIYARAPLPADFFACLHKFRLIQKS